MHKKPAKRSTFNPLTQKIKAPEHLSRLQDYQDKYSDSSNRIQLPNLERGKSWRDNDNDVSSWDTNSRATSASWSPDIEDDATSKVLQQWDAVERTLYDEEDQVVETTLLEECTQWRSQIPHLRIIGKSPFFSGKNILPDPKLSSGEIRSSSEVFEGDIFPERSFPQKERSTSSKHRPHKTSEDEVYNTVFAYVISELFHNKENGIDSLNDNLSEALKISPAPVYSNKSSAKSLKINWTEEMIPLEEKFSVKKNNTKEDNFSSMHKEMVKTSIQGNQKRSEVLEGNAEKKGSKQKLNENIATAADRLKKSQMGRNKLGTVFNEKIVVSPVPYVLSTRESFSTVRTTPIKFMGQQPLTVSALQGSGRNNSAFRNSAKYAIATRISNGHSAWHAPVCPTVWPKNIKLAPIDTSRLPSSKNRSLAPSPVLQRNRKSLSPIPRSSLPVSAHTVRNNNEMLSVQGKHIVPGQSPKLNLLSSGWDYSPRIENVKKKKNRLQQEI